MNGLQVFNYGEQKIRTLLVDGELRWVLKDVCVALNQKGATRAAHRLEDDEVSLAHCVDAIGKRQKMLVINESGLYKTMLHSDKPEAKAFTRWFTRKVLPTIRKTGGYTAAETKPMRDILQEMCEIDAMCAEVEKRKRELSRMLLDSTALSYKIGGVRPNYPDGRYEESATPAPRACPSQGGYSPVNEREKPDRAGDLVESRKETKTVMDFLAQFGVA